MVPGDRVQTTDAYHPDWRLVGTLRQLTGGIARVEWDGRVIGCARVHVGYIELEGAPSGRRLHGECADGA